MSTEAPAVTGTELPRLLFVTSEAEYTRVLELLRSARVDVATERASSAEELKAALAKPWDLTLCGPGLPGLGFREVAPLLREKAPEHPFLVLTAAWNEAEMRAAL